jgi:aryl-alcohol dehydrogenase-like predicted oxidoreductase
MQYTYLGQTGVKVSRLCLGCMSYGSTKWRPWVLEQQAAMPFFRKAVEAGINFFDTADVYLPLEHKLLHLFDEEQMPRKLTEATLG